MSIAAAQADQFVSEVVATRIVWAIRDSDGFPTSTNASGETAMPFWSAESRAQKVINEVPAYSDFKPHQLSLNEFLDRWLVGMERDKFVVGLNWSGTSAKGYDISPADVRARIVVATG